MSFASVALRELRAEARRPLTHGLRVAGVLGLLMTVGVAALTAALDFVANTQPEGSLLGRWSVAAVLSTTWLSALGQTPQDAGAALFGYFQAVMFVGFWLVAPLLTADCLSRERRERTLPLLFLTRLSPLGIVLGKSLAHGLRALSLGLAMLPMLAVPVAFGGVSMADLEMAALLDGCALVLGLTAGLLASCWVRDRLKAIGLAELFSAMFALAVMHGHDWALRQAVLSCTVRVGPWGQPLERWGIPPGFFGRVAWLAFQSSNLPEPAWRARRFGAWGAVSPQWSSIWADYPAAVHRQWLRGVRLLFGLAMGCAGLGVGLAAARVHRLWRDPGPPPALEAVRQTWCVPRLAPGLWRRYSAKAIERNPIGWLAIRSAPARLTKWLWCLSVMLGVQLAALDPWDVAPGLAALASLMLAALTFAAVLGFRRELETGVLELLLVSPLTPRQILWGRLRALWGQFLPAAAVLALSYGIGINFRPLDLEQMLMPAVVFGWLFVALPIFGLLFSLFCWPPALSWALAGACGASGWVLADWLRFAGYAPGVAWPLAAACHLGLMAQGWAWAEQRLDRRQFVLK